MRDLFNHVSAVPTTALLDRITIKVLKEILFLAYAENEQGDIAYLTCKYFEDLVLKPTIKSIESVLPGYVRRKIKDEILREVDGWIMRREYSIRLLRELLRESINAPYKDVKRVLGYEYFVDERFIEGIQCRIDRIYPRVRQNR